MSQTRLVEVNRYRFSAEALTEIETVGYAANNWPGPQVIKYRLIPTAYFDSSTALLTSQSTSMT
jgi:hypothetical protein